MNLKSGNYWMYRGFVVKILENNENYNTVMIYRETGEFVDNFESKIGQEYTKAKQLIDSEKYDG